MRVSYLNSSLGYGSRIIIFVILPYRQMSTPLTPIKTLMGIWKIAMEIITDEIENLKSAWKKHLNNSFFMSWNPNMDFQEQHADHLSNSCMNSSNKIMETSVKIN